MTYWLRLWLAIASCGMAVVLFPPLGAPTLARCLLVVWSSAVGVAMAAGTYRLVSGTWTVP